MNQIGTIEFPINKFFEADAEALKKLANDAGFSTTMLESPDATRDKVIGAIEQAAGALTSGDIFLLTYAGHGGQIANIDSDEEDKLEETWGLFDGQLIDDELNLLWGKFYRDIELKKPTAEPYDNRGTLYPIRPANAIYGTDEITYPDPSCV